MTAEERDALRADLGRASADCAAAVATEFAAYADTRRRSAEQWFALLSRARWLRTMALRRDKSWPEASMARFALLAAVPAAASRVEGLPVDVSVKRNICNVLARLPALARTLDCSSWEFHELAQAVTLQRFPAGQHNWVVGGAGRAPLLRMRVRPAHALRLLHEVTSRYGGFAPVASIHLSPWRDKPVVLRTEACRSFYRIARSMELQPRLKGIQGMSWLHSECLRDVTPHLAWARDLFIDNGAFTAEMEQAPPDCGVLTGSAERKRLYESGVFRPRVTLVLWHRDDVLDWAARHPEFGDAAPSSARVLAEPRVARRVGGVGLAPHLVPQ